MGHCYKINKYMYNIDSPYSTWKKISQLITLAFVIFNISRILLLVLVLVSSLPSTQACSLSSPPHYALMSTVKKCGVSSHLLFAAYHPRSCSQDSSCTEALFELHSLHPSWKISLIFKCLWSLMPGLVISHCHSLFVYFNILDVLFYVLNHRLGTLNIEMINTVAYPFHMIGIFKIFKWH